MDEQRIAVLGAGSWGSALAWLLGGQGHRVSLWDRDAEIIARMQEGGVNTKYLPDRPLGENVTPTPHAADALDGADWALLAVSSRGVRAVIDAAAPALRRETAILSAVKGLEAETGLTPSEVIAEQLVGVPYAGLAVLSGPNLAAELVRGVPTATVVAADDPAIARAAQSLLMTEKTFRVYTHTDVRGVEYGGALKNVLAIGGGLSDGLGFGDNTKATLLTRGLLEMTQLGVAAGGQALTFLGLSGVGDLIATAGSRLSRNYRVGLCLAAGKTVIEAMEEVGRAAEGVPTALAARALARRNAIETPVLEAIAQVVEGLLSPQDAVEGLMTRPARDEFSL